MSDEQQQEISIKLNATQQAFVTSHAEADLFSCRMGEGKSTSLVWAIFYHTQLNPGARWAVIRDTWENLKDTTLLEFFKWFPKDVMVSWKASEKRATWLPRSGLEGDVVFLGILDEKDAGKLQSREFAGFAIDETAPAAGVGGISQFVFTTCLTRLRQPGMKWYSAKIAQNSSDETHWTYKMFFDPGYEGNPDLALPPTQTRGFRFFQTAEPENEKNLPPGYYPRMADRYIAQGRPDLASRFAEGEIGFQQPGKPVTPEFSKSNHVRRGLLEISQADLLLLWDFGGNPTCIFTQNTPMGHWNILEAHVSDGGMGIYELIEDVVAGRISRRFHGANILHYGDPAGDAPEQSSSKVTAVKVMKDLLGGRWYPGPVRLQPRVQPLRAVLGKMHNGTGLVQIDEQLAKPVWHALRGGWHFVIHNNGVVSDQPKKDAHSHPGDAMGYGAAEIYPAGKLKTRRGASGFVQQQQPRYGIREPTRVEAMFGVTPGAPPPPEDGSAMPVNPQTYSRPRWGGQEE